MDDDRLTRSLNLIDEPSTPRAEFVDDLHDILAEELGLTTSDQPRPVQRGPVRSRERVGLLAVAALLIAGLGAVGSGLIGEQRTIAPTFAPLGTFESEAPLATASARAASSASPTPELTPSILALRAGGLVVFEHWDLPSLGLTRLEYLASDLSGQELLPDVAGVQENPAWSPDGTRLAFAGLDPLESEPERIWETDARGSAPTLVSIGCAPPECVGERDPAYSRDGRSLVFVRTELSTSGSQTTSVVGIRDLAEGTLTLLESTRVDAASARNRHPGWSPDGSQVVYATTQLAEGAVVGSIISVVGADDSGLRQLVDPELVAGDPSWAADGSVILFSSLPIHEFQVADVPALHMFTVRPDGSDLRQLDRDGGAGAPRWSPDGSQILFTKLIGFTRGGIGDLGPERPNLMVMDRDGSNVRPVTAFGKCCRWYWTQQPTPG